MTAEFLQVWVTLDPSRSFMELGHPTVKHSLGRHIEVVDRADSGHHERPFFKETEV